MRLDKLLYETGFGSRGTVKKLIKSKQVYVGGKAADSDSLNVDPEWQHIEVSGKKIDYQPHVYYMLYKPAGVVTAVSDKKNQTVLDLIHEKDRRTGLYPVGRLDKDTEGLLLLTNNGPLGYQLLLPDKKVRKTYEAVVNERVTPEDQTAFETGIVFHGGIRCKSAKLTLLNQDPNESRVRLEISEGKFHQVKKMFLARGKKVTFLKRTEMGPIRLDEQLEPGSYRPLRKIELEKLLAFFH